MYRDYDNPDAQFSELKGKILESIEGLEVGSEQVTFKCTDGTTYLLTYYQDCCARCSVEDIAGDIKDLVGKEILLADLVQSSEVEGSILEQRKALYEKAKAEFDEKRPNSPDDFYFYGPTPGNGFKDESETWSFYKLATILGSVTIRWYGSSNGYYSETATFERVKS